MSSSIAPPLRIVPDVVRNAAIHVLPVEATAEEAARLMTRVGTGAVVVLDAGGRFAGLVTEQDIVREVVARGLEAGAAPLAALVNRNSDTLTPSDLALDALELMRIRNVSYLPVLDGGRITAVVSIRDICEAVRHILDAQLRTQQTAFFSGQLRE